LAEALLVAKAKLPVEAQKAKAREVVTVNDQVLLVALIP
jgi:hypothetical protein